MAITMMRSREILESDPENVVVVHDYPGAESGVRHSPRCKHHSGRTERNGALTPDCVERLPYSSSVPYDTLAGCHVVEPLYMHTTHRGLVLDLGEVNGRDDSDFYAVVWNPEKKCPVRVEYASTRGWTYPNHASIDATPEVIAAYNAYVEECRQAAAARLEAQRAEERAKAEKLEQELARVRALHGSTITVGKGKKAFTGQLFWSGISRTRTTVRVGVKASDGVVKWLASTAV